MSRNMYTTPTGTKKREEKHKGD